MGNHNSTTKPNAYLNRRSLQMSSHHPEVHQHNDQQIEHDIAIQNNLPSNNNESNNEGQDNNDTDEIIVNNNLIYSDEGTVTLMGYMHKNVSFHQMFKDNINTECIEGDTTTAQPDQQQENDDNIDEFPTNDTTTQQDSLTNDVNPNLCNIEITELNCDEKEDEKEMEYTSTEENYIKISDIHEQTIVHNTEPFDDDDVQNHNQRQDSKDNILEQSSTNEVFDEQNNNRTNLSLNPYAGEFIPKNKVYIGKHDKLPIIYEHMELTELKEQITFQHNPSYKARIHKIEINDSRDRTPRPLKKRNDDGTIQCKQKITAIFENSAYQKQYSALKMSEEATNKISSRIRENMYHLYNHIFKSMAMQQDNQFALKNDIKIKIIHLGVHDKITNEPLYCVAETCNISNYKWKLLERAFTANDIKSEFDIRCEHLPKLWMLHPDFQPQLKYPEKIKYLMQNEIDMKALINRTKWTKHIEIYNKKNNVKRTTLSLTKQTFLKQFNEYMICDEYRYGHDQELIPIVMPATHGHEMQFVRVVKLEKTDIFVAFKYEEQSNSIKVTGIHLDPAFILSQHQLLFPGSTYNSLEHFQSNFDHLVIGNPDLIENNMNYYKNRCDKFRQFVKNSQQYFVKMVQNTSNITGDNIEHWIDKSRNVCKNSKNANYSLDLSCLINKNESVKSQKSSSSQEASLYIQNLQQINNWYFQQTLNPTLQPIIPHPVHKKTVSISPQQMKLRVIT